jgi:hypothetical protein
VTITFPRSLPAFANMKTALFRLMQYVAVTPLRNGKMPATELGQAYWKGFFETRPLNRWEFGEFAACWDSMRGGVKTFKANDPMRPYPNAYRAGFGGLTRAGGGAFDGTADVTALTASTIALATLPAGFVVTAGDYVGLTEGSLIGLYRIIEAVTANGSGVATVTVEPKILSAFTAAAVANFEKPPAEFVIDHDSWDGMPSISAAPIKFEAWQKVQ